MFRVPKYNFFGPHLGVLYGRYELLDQLQAYKVRPAEDIPPHKFETGTKGLSDNSLLSVGGSSQVGWVTRSRL